MTLAGSLTLEVNSCYFITFECLHDRDDDSRVHQLGRWLVVEDTAKFPPKLPRLRKKILESEQLMPYLAEGREKDKKRD